ncbi:MAG: haloacid dehalogenase-like hydrolase [Bacteroidales bacterium]
MRKLRKFSGLLILALVLTACKPSENKSCCNSGSCGEQAEKTYLSSWSDRTKQQIMNYVEDVTNPQSENFIPIADRIATFDNDGTLWSEQPIASQLYFAIDEIKRMAKDHPEWINVEPYKSAIAGDMKSLLSQGQKALQIMIDTHAGMSSEEFTQAVRAWIDTAKHPVKQRLYTDLVYQPMLELLDYLRANNFKTFIVSGGGATFMRAWAEEVYGIPRNQIIGTYFDAEFDYADGQARINRKPKIEFYDDKEAKPVAIDRFIGRRPVFACGNSDGDLQMLQYTDANKYRSFQLYVHHTDAEREFEYGREALMGALDKGLDEALAKKWCLVDMKTDWKVVYP